MLKRTVLGATCGVLALAGSAALQAAPAEAATFAPASSYRAKAMVCRVPPARVALRVKNVSRVAASYQIPVVFRGYGRRMIDTTVVRTPVLAPGATWVGYGFGHKASGIKGNSRVSCGVGAATRTVWS